MLIDSPEPTLQISKAIIITVALCMAAFLVFAVGFVVKSHRKQVETGFEGLVGQIGKVKETIDGDGMVFVAGALWHATADEKIEAGEKVRILSGEHTTLKVKRIDSHKEG